MTTQAPSRFGILATAGIAVLIVGAFASQASPDDKSAPATGKTDDKYWVQVYAGYNTQPSAPDPRVYQVTVIINGQKPKVTRVEKNKKLPTTMVCRRLPRAPQRGCRQEYGPFEGPPQVQVTIDTFAGVHSVYCGINLRRPGEFVYAPVGTRDSAKSDVPGGKTTCTHQGFGA